MFYHYRHYSLFIHKGYSIQMADKFQRDFASLPPDDSPWMNHAV